ncbi:MAG: hypothetical protein E6K53_09835 [Gammaproteobacteria bacterium]|nr:MAG: hypothetical protein E6K53_09835 [Gammaproteobacteria bacterium]
MLPAFASTARIFPKHKLLRILFLIGCLSAPAFSQSTTPEEIEQRRIQYLISAIADLKDTTFIRNGSEYNAQRAANHLRLKLRFAGNRVKTAEDFIVCCATTSSMSGEKYWIKFPDGHMVESATFLREKLAAYALDSSNPQQ